ncbi:asparagine synthase (glutamine-hydrolyzing) [Candidatus Marinimicrobia bacterium]|nr:asparagine synthase (glutamine-hydrolyzing) [Candidatus Neomarinimicrobiota bacterium]
MCGISGIINQKNSNVNKDDIVTINNLASHRGPDGEGYYHSNNLSFGHRRLAIIDLTNNGHQPMSYKNDYTITFNGEVYNYIELKEELKDCGYIFNSASDTEVVLASYAHWGEKCVERFNGQWSFAIHDKKKNIVFASRDRFGIKPFYYSVINDNFIFGSEIKQVIHFKNQNKLNMKTLMDYLVIGFEEHSNETFFDGIYKLKQSHNLIYSLESHTFKEYRYYDIEKKENLSELSLDQSVEEYYKKFSEAVKLRLRSDVEVGTCLSGGLDSSAIAAISSKEYKKNANMNFLAFHAKTSDKNRDESNYAREIADNFNIDLKILNMNNYSFIEKLDEIIYTQEEPFSSTSIFMQYFIMEEARKNGCKVLLDGQGGDETLLGYERYYPAYFRGLTLIDSFKEFFYSISNSKINFLRMIAYILYFSISKIRLITLKFNHRKIKNEYYDLISKKLIIKNSNAYRDIFKLQYIEIYNTQLSRLLKYEDKNSMRNSVETRLPFIDYKVVEAALSFNPAFKINKGWTKYILRKSMDGILPKNVLWRRNKVGFEAPQKTWIDLNTTYIMEQISQSKILKEIYKELNVDNFEHKMIWKLFCIAKWEKIYNVEL